MTAPGFTNATWITSSYSGSSGGNCVEIAHATDESAVGVRDSKHRDGGTLTLRPTAWRALLANTALS